MTANYIDAARDRDRRQVLGSTTEPSPAMSRNGVPLVVLRPPDKPTRRPRRQGGARPEPEAAAPGHSYNMRKRQTDDRNL